MSESFVRMFVMVQPSQRRLGQGTCESPLDNTLVGLRAGGFPLYTYLYVWEEFYWGIILDSAKSALIGPGDYAGSTGQQH